MHVSLRLLLVHLIRMYAASYISKVKYAMRLDTSARSERAKRACSL